MLFHSSASHFEERRGRERSTASSADYTLQLSGLSRRERYLLSRTLVWTEEGRPSEGRLELVSSLILNWRRETVQLGKQVAEGKGGQRP